MGGDIGVGCRQEDLLGWGRQGRNTGEETGEETDNLEWGRSREGTEVGRKEERDTLEETRT